MIPLPPVEDLRDEDCIGTVPANSTRGGTDSGFVVVTLDPTDEECVFGVVCPGIGVRKQLQVVWSGLWVASQQRQNDIHRGPRHRVPASCP